jgi:hypothetical protein
MALIRLDPKTIIAYIPRFERNNIVDPLVVNLHYVSASRFDDYLNKMGRELREVSLEHERIAVHKAHDKNFFLSEIESVENFNDADGSAIVDIGVFYDSIDSELRAELIEAMKNQALLTEGQRKN